MHCVCVNVCVNVFGCVCRLTVWRTVLGRLCHCKTGASRAAFVCLCVRVCVSV